MYGHKETGQPGARAFKFENGMLYFTKQAERKFFFIMTLVMLLAGVLAKAGLF